MTHKLILFVSLLSFVFPQSLSGMEGEKNAMCGPFNPFYHDYAEKTGQEKEDDFNKMLELVPLFRYAVQIAKNELKAEALQSSLESDNLNHDQSLFQPLFDGEDMRSYSKLDSHLVNSFLDNSPPLLRFQIEIMKNPAIYNSLNDIKGFSINKLLLYGPPGSGKSSLAKAIADYCNFPRQFINASSLVNQYKNSGQSNFRYIFGPLLTNKKYVAIILDELTGLTNRHGKKDNPDEGVVEQLLGILDHCEAHKNVLFIATTNEIKDLPEQLKDRFCGSTFKIEKPDFERCKKLINALFEDDIIKEENNFIINDTDELEVEKKITFIHIVDSTNISWITKQVIGLKFTQRQLLAMESLARIFALQRNCDEKYTILEDEIEICLQDYKNSIQYIQIISKENSKSLWNRYYKNFKEIYPLVIQLLHLGGSLYLQHHGTKMQLEFSNMWQERLAKSQKEFQEQSHRETMLLQRQHNQESLEQSKVTSEKQLEIQQNSAQWALFFGAVDFGIKISPFIAQLWNTK